VVAGSVRHVNRRFSLVVSVAAIATLTSACSTFSDSDNIARVDDATLTGDDLETQLTDLSVPTDQALPGDAVRAQITTWIQEQLASGDTPALSDEELATRYDAGFDSSGVVCANGIVVADEAAASRVAGELEDGAEFGELLVAENLDDALTEAGGNVGCVTNEILAQAPDVEFIRVASTLSPEVPVAYAPLVDPTGVEFAWVVVSFRDFAALEPADLELLSTTITSADRLAEADIFVDPRYGTFDATTGQVVGLG
jgi:hypothetical protein